MRVSVRGLRIVVSARREGPEVFRVAARERWRSVTTVLISWKGVLAVLL